MIIKEKFKEVLMQLGEYQSQYIYIYIYIYIYSNVSNSDISNLIHLSKFFFYQMGFQCIKATLVLVFNKYLLNLPF